MREGLASPTVPVVMAEPQRPADRDGHLAELAAVAGAKDRKVHQVREVPPARLVEAISRQAQPGQGRPREQEPVRVPGGRLGQHFGHGVPGGGEERCHLVCREPQLAVIQQRAAGCVEGVALGFGVLDAEVGHRDDGGVPALGSERITSAVSAGRPPGAEMTQARLPRSSDRGVCPSCQVIAGTSAPRRAASLVTAPARLLCGSFPASSLMAAGVISRPEEAQGIDATARTRSEGSADPLSNSPVLVSRGS